MPTLQAMVKNQMMSQKLKQLKKEDLLTPNLKKTLLRNKKKWQRLS